MTVNLDLGDTRLILATCQAGGLLRNQAAYCLATAFHESAHTMRPVEEAFYLGDKAHAYRASLRYAPWWGRGYVQLTHQENYLRAGQQVGADLITAPQRAMEPDIAALILVRGMRDGWFTGKKLSDYITLQRSDFVGARRIVNGTDKASEIAAIARDYDAALRAEGYGEEPAEPAPAPASKLGRIAAHVAAINAILGEP